MILPDEHNCDPEKIPEDYLPNEWPIVREFCWRQECMTVQNLINIAFNESNSHNIGVMTKNLQHLLSVKRDHRIVPDDYLPNAPQEDRLKYWKADCATIVACQEYLREELGQETQAA